MAQIVAQPVVIGPFFAGDTAPDIDFILLWDAGGYVDVTGAVVTCNVRRWDVRRSIPLGPIITSGTCTLGAPTRGEATFSWISAGPIGNVPVDPGWYMAYVIIDFPSGKTQGSQRVLFEVKPA